MRLRGSYTPTRVRVTEIATRDVDTDSRQGGWLGSRPGRSTIPTIRSRPSSNSNSRSTTTSHSSRSSLRFGVHRCVGLRLFITLFTSCRCAPVRAPSPSFFCQPYALPSAVEVAIVDSSVPYTSLTEIFSADQRSPADLICQNAVEVDDSLCSITKDTILF